ncbi:hypothetical protein BS47DRAFT_1403066 [Hydnum rufescens UP504]|uniref:Uncharacterized protein n=1 Tax=Hydnum rufescens UP504 TaxID=1448309 RepID=A0A9P6AAT3_9AGAM|nr:hypothetical protein BS47DRAFT_1403066 [Hydnum rufescens UP504]
MSRAVEVKHPSPWYIQYPIFVSDNNQSIWSIFNGLFGAGLREVDSAMAATLANLLGPSSVTLCHVVPLPSRKTSPPEGKGELVAIDAEIDLDEEPTPPNLDHEDLTPQVDPTTNLPEWNDLDSDLSVEDDEEPRLNDTEIAAKARIAAQIEKARNEDPLWAQVTADLGLALAGNADAHERILLMVLAAQSKRKVYHTTLETYMLQRWSQPCSNPRPAHPCKNNQPRVTSHRLPSGEHASPRRPSHWSHSRSPLRRLPPSRFRSPHCFCSPSRHSPSRGSPSHYSPSRHSPPHCSPPRHSPHQSPPRHSPPHSPPNQQYGPEMEINHQEQETPVCPVVSPPDPGDSEMQDVQQAVPPPQDHMPVDPPFQAALPIAPPLSPCDEQGGTNEVGLEPSGEMVEDLDPLVVVGDWYRIEFFGVTADVDIKAIFQLLMHDGLLGVRVRKNKTAKGPARKKQKVLLAFKSQRRRDLILERFVSGHYSLWEFEQAVSVPTSPSDLATLLEHAPPHREIGDLRELHPFPPPPGADASLRHYIRYRFLDFYRYPPVVRDCDYPPPQVMDRVDFSTKWLLEALDEVDHAVRRRLAMIVNSHMDRFNHNIVPFWVPLYVTGGPYDILVRELAQKAKDSAALGDTSIRKFVKGVFAMCQVVTYRKSQLRVPKHKAFDDPSEEPSSSGAQESSKINAMSQELSYPQINIGRRKVDDEANDKVNDETANMEKSESGIYPTRNLTLKSPKSNISTESRRSASLLNGTPTSSQVDYPDDPPLLPIQSSEPERASSTFGYNEEPTVLLSGSHVQTILSPRRIGDPRKLLDDARTLALNLPTSIPEACPGDLLYVWDATQVDTLLWSLPDQGQIPVKTASSLISTLNHDLSRLHSKKQLRVPFKVPYGKGKGVEAISEDEVESRDADLGSDIEAGVSNIKDDDNIDDTQLSSDGEGQPHQPQYNRGPFPTALVDEVHGVTEAFHHTLEAMAKKYNCLLHQVL